MSVRISDEAEERIHDLMFRGFGSSQAERFLRQEIERYAPELRHRAQEEIASFVQYQRGVFLDGEVPVLGTPIASLNPKFCGAVEDIVLSMRGSDMYTRASIKENGFRLQLHNTTHPMAFTRQFTRYDLRMFPELTATFPMLPLMVGDAELISRHYTHLAGFARVEKRVPQSMWPKMGAATVEDTLLDKYFADEELFEIGKPRRDIELTLCFHGLYAISDPSTWELSKEKQFESLANVCRLPVDYRRIDGLLDLLDEFMARKNVNARVVHREQLRSKKALRVFVEKAFDAGHEGACVVQYSADEAGVPTFDVGKSFKIKKYETIDTALIGLILHDSSAGLREDNVTGAVLGLYDAWLQAYLPVCKVNLDPEGVQVKEEHQRNRLVPFRKNLVRVVERQPRGDGIVTLYDAFLGQGQFLLRSLLDPTTAVLVPEMLDSLPRGHDVLSSYEHYGSAQKEFDSGRGSKKSSTKQDQYVHAHLAVFQALDLLQRNNWSGFQRFVRYFGHAKELKSLSKKLARPQIVVSTSPPIIVEAKVFRIKWAANQYPAGFHKWYCNSFMFENVFAERLRPDKNTTTDYQTIYDFARRNTVR
ncbi:hypothetical protein HY490_03070 [Candidatus Woesearchaeota archaeon]|nr:hypothetical protein [Candidatus Woesearchaeota archaeon]